MRVLRERIVKRGVSVAFIQDPWRVVDSAGLLALRDQWAFPVYNILGCVDLLQYATYQLRANGDVVETICAGYLE
jgi:hypothetical protein